MQKRGQVSGASAATLIGLITLVLIFYIVFLPPAERQKLLMEEPEQEIPGGPGMPEKGSENVILNAPVGRLEFVSKTEVSHVIPNVILTESKNAQVLAVINPFRISKSLFGSENKVTTFTIQDIENVENVFLAFTTLQHDGILRIKLNGIDLFEGDINSFNPMPLAIRKELLQRVNTIEFEIVGSPVVKQLYIFEEVKIIGDLRDVAKQTSKNFFAVENSEITNFKKSTLNFYAVCQQDFTGVLQVKLNDKTVYSSVPLCDSLNRLELFREEFAFGKNSLTFNLERGTVTIEQLRIKTELEPAKPFLQYFTVTDSLLNDLLLERKILTLELEFVDDRKPKSVELNVNGRLEIIDQTEPLFVKDISDIVKAGNNFVQLTPLKSVDVLRLQIKAEE